MGQAMVSVGMLGMLAPAAVSNSSGSEVYQAEIHGQAVGNAKLK